MFNLKFNPTPKNLLIIFNLKLHGINKYLDRGQWLIAVKQIK